MTRGCLKSDLCMVTQCIMCVFGCKTRVTSYIRMRGWSVEREYLARLWNGCKKNLPCCLFTCMSEYNMFMFDIWDRRVDPTSHPCIHCPGWRVDLKSDVWADATATHANARADAKLQWNQQSKHTSSNVYTYASSFAGWLRAAIQTHRIYHVLYVRLSCL